jgi:hypothetical protein
MIHYTMWSLLARGITRKNLPWMLLATFRSGVTMELNAALSMVVATASQRGQLAMESAPRLNMTPREI